MQRLRREWVIWIIVCHHELHHLVKYSGAVNNFCRWVYLKWRIIQYKYWYTVNCITCKPCMHTLCQCCAQWTLAHCLVQMGPWTGKVEVSFVKTIIIFKDDAFHCSLKLSKIYYNNSTIPLLDATRMIYWVSLLSMIYEQYTLVWYHKVLIIIYYS